MNFRIVHIVKISVLIILVGCENNSKNEEPDILPPVITYPANNSTISGEFEVKIDLDESIEYESVQLLINGVEFYESLTPPHTFTLNSYYISGESSNTLIAKANTSDGRVLRSQGIVFDIDKSAEDSIFTLLNDIFSAEEFEFTHPYGTEYVTAFWSPIIGAKSYEIQIRDVFFLTNENFLELPLVYGENPIQMRASNGSVWGKWINLRPITVSPPQEPVVHSSYESATGVVKLEVDLDDSATYSSVNLYINDNLVSTVTSPPYHLEFAPYFWTTDVAAKWWIEAVYDNSEAIRTVPELTNSNDFEIIDPITITLPIGGPNYFGVNSLDFSWNPIPYASAYEFRIGSEVYSSTSAQGRIENLNPGTYEVQVRAVNEFGYSGPWSSAQSFSITLPGPPEFSFPQFGENFCGRDNVLIEWKAVKGANSYEYYAKDQWISINTTQIRLSTVELMQYSTKVRAVDALGRYGEAAEIKFFVNAPVAPEIVDPISNMQFSNVNPIVFSFSDVECAKRYQYMVGDHWFDLDASPMAIKVADPGSYSVLLRSVDQFDRVGAATTISFTVIPPSTPKLHPPSLAWNEGRYILSLEWESSDSEDTYIVEIQETGEQYQTAENSIDISLTDVGEYSWRVKRINSIDHESAWSSYNSIEVGIIDLTIGGSNQEIAKKLLPSSYGGYWLLATTSSPENSGFSTGNYAWIMKISELGAITSEYVYDSADLRVNDILEMPNGDLLAIGGNSAEQIGITTIFDSGLSVISSFEFNPLQTPSDFQFTKAFYLNDQVYLASSFRSSLGDQSAGIFTFNPANATPIETLPDLEISGLRIESIISGFDLGDGKLTVAGTAFPDGSNDFLLAGAYLATFTDGVWQSSWNNVSEGVIMGVYDSLLLDNQSVLLVGSSPFGPETKLLNVRQNSVSEITVNGLVYSRASATSNSGFILFSVDQSTEIMQLAYFDEAGREYNRDSLDSIGLYASPEAVNQLNGSIAYVYSLTDLAKLNYDIVLKRVSD